MRKGCLFVISGPSGTGKGTVCNELLNNNDDIYLSVSATSRQKAEGEEEGVTYYYKTADEFKQMADRGEMLEWAVYNGNYYGTPKKPVTDRLEQGIDVILEIDVQGAFKVKSSYSDAVLLFIAPPGMAELRRRLVNRAREDIEIIEKRIKTAKTEIEVVDKYDYIVVNDSLFECVANIEKIIKAESFRVHRNSEFTEKLKKEF